MKTLTSPEQPAVGHTPGLNKLTLIRLLVLVFPFFLILQNPELKDYFDIQPGPKLYHYLLPVFFAVFLFRGSRRRLLELGMLFLVACVNLALIREMNQQFFSFVLFVLMICSSAGVSDNHDRWFRAGCWIAIGTILLNIVAHAPDIISSGAQNAEDRAIYPTLMAAGVNIELSTLVLLLIYATPASIGLITGLTFALYYVFGTRAILIIWCVYMMVAFNRIIGQFIARHWGKMLAALLLTIAIAVYSLAELQLAAFERILQIGKDPGSIGRLMLYEVAFSSSNCFSIGCGLGSARTLIESTRIANFFEDNFHNVYLQLLVELGLPGLIAYVLLLVAAIRASRKHEEMGLYICLLSTFFLNFIQFTGYEILSAYFIGRAIRVTQKIDAVDHRLR